MHSLRSSTKEVFTHELNRSLESTRSSTSYFDVPDTKASKLHIAIQTDKTSVSHSEQTSQTVDTESKVDQKFAVETQTEEAVGSAKDQEVIVEIPEKLLENMPSQAPSRVKLPQLVTKLIVKKVDDTWKFNFIGAFFNFDDMHPEEIIKIQKMLNETCFEVCERAANFRRVKHTKSLLTA